MRRLPFIAAAVVAPLVLSGCELLGIESAAQIAERRTAEGKALGAGCRHANRSIEACFELHKRADKAAVFAGWKEMSEYMAENKLEAQPALPAEAAASSPAEAESADAETGARVASRQPK
jgi:hypothetical protein